MRRLVTSALIAAIAGLGPPAASAPARAQAIRAVSGLSDRADMIIDTRPRALCEAASLPGARCLPAADILGPHNRLANISGLLWLLGTAGLTGRETALVAGGAALDRDFIAGLLYLAGQKMTLVLTTPIATARVDLAPGTARSTTRGAVYQAPMRADKIILRADLLQMIRSAAAPPIRDGRSEAEYWGVNIRAARGGHIPGAQLAPAPALAGRDTSLAAPTTQPIIYGHDARDGIAFLARLVAAGHDASVYLEGWSGWASDGALPADNVTYRDSSTGARKTRALSPAKRSDRGARWRMAGLVLAGLGLAAGGYLIGRRAAPRGG